MLAVIPWWNAEGGRTLNSVEVERRQIGGQRLLGREDRLKGVRKGLVILVLADNCFIGTVKILDSRQLMCVL